MRESSLSTTASSRIFDSVQDSLNTTALTVLRETIEALALEVRLHGFHSPKQIQTLATNIQREAEAAELPAVAAIAAELDRVPSEQSLRDAVSRLQQLLAPPAAEAWNQDPELVADFILESRAHLSTVESQLLALEQDPENAEAVNAIFRGFHSIKGLSGFLEFHDIQEFAHEVETLLDLARNLRLSIDSDLIDVILQSADHMRQCLLGVEAGLENQPPDEPLSARIRKMIARATTSSDLAQLERAVASNPQAAPAGPRSLKVDTGKLDYLVDMVSELVIAQSLILHDPGLAAAPSARLTRNLRQLTRITADVQQVAMTMRMIPVGQLFQRMARLVRDLARSAGKQVNLELTGEDAELDRNMVEELADPLMHMVRNAVDHGAELPSARVAAGKNPTAQLELKAYHQGGSINIEVSDDGHGLVREKILAAAQQRGLVGAGDRLSDQEVFSLIFEPGFSTAERVTAVSGRGVGMDVVRRQILKLRGRIDISSTAGKGTTFQLKLPLTLAIIEGLVIGVGKERYVVPMFTIRELLRPAPESLSIVPGGGEMVLLRGSLLPVLRLHARFGVAPASLDTAAGILIVAECERKSFCLLVDELIGKQEVVIKSLGESFQDVTGIAGGCILGDGRVALVLDMEALFGNPTLE
jgi:two-component system chemotaxis sensor kinase CheA